MNCDLCSLEMAEGTIAAAPCCTRRFHTVCLVKRVVALDLYHDAITCPCGNNLYTVEHAEETDITPILENEEIREEIKEVKQKAKNANRARVSLAKLLREKKQIFKTVAAVHLTALEGIIKEEKATVRQNPVYKQYNNNHRAYVQARRAFKQKHGLDWNGMRQIFGCSWQHGVINTSGNYMIKYIFRVRL